MKPDKIIDGISKQIMTSLNEMGKANTTEERLKHSKIIKNLCYSIDVFFCLMNEIAAYDYEDEDEDEDDNEDDNEDEDDNDIPF